MTDGPMRIAYLIDEMVLGGAQRQLAGLIRRLPEEYAPFLYCLSQPGLLGEELAAEGIFVQSYGMDNLWTLRGWRTCETLVRDLKAKRIRILHSFLGTANLIAPWVGHRAGAKVVTSRRDTGYWMSTAFRLCARIMAKHADAITANATAVRDAAVRLEHLRPDRIRIIPNGIDPSVALFDEERAEVRSEFGLHPEHLLIVQAATLSAVKDHRLTIQAAKALLPDYPHLRWLFVGDGDEREFLLQLVEDAQVDNVVTLVGARKDARQLIAASDIAVLTSRAEGLPNAVLEAMAAGVPVVSTDAGGVRDLVVPGETGEIVPVGDTAAFAKAVARLAESEGLRAQYGEAGRERVAARFTWDTVLAAWLALYGEVCGDA